MAFIPSFPENHHLSDVFKTFPQHVKPLLEYHDLLLRADSPFTVAERELIAAYVSSQNACGFCFGSHAVISENFGIEEDVIAAMVEDVDGAAIDAKMKPVLHYVAKLTKEPSRIVQADAQAVLDAGWSERALFDAVSVCALFNFMNRIVEGMGVKANQDMLADRRQTLREKPLAERRAMGEAHSGEPDYMAFGRNIGVVD